MRSLFLLIVLLKSLFATQLQYDLYKKDGKLPGDTLLIVGGIHGDEPGSYFAPMLISSYYEIEKGSVWVIPNLNFDSIVAHRRGVYGDMNRKFAHIDPSDPDYEIVNDVKDLITDPAVDMVLNLHDGHGYYRPKWESSIFNPAAWGQANIIDQKKVPNLKYGNLDEIAHIVANRVNENYLDEEYHRFGVKNTKTSYKDEQQQLSLTYFAITNGKAAFAIETSKNIEQLYLKVFYQLQAIEAYMDIMGIEYDRGFELTKENVKRKVYDYGTVTINNSIKFDLNELKRVLYFVPLPTEGTTIKSDNPLVAFLPHQSVEQSIYKLNVGHKTVSYLYPDYFKQNDSLQKLSMLVDGKEKKLPIPSHFEYKNNFKVQAPDGYRINVIGFTKVPGNQNRVLVHTHEIQKRFSPTVDEKQFRIEIYKDDTFVGMVIAKDVSE